MSGARGPRTPRQWLVERPELLEAIARGTPPLLACRALGIQPKVAERIARLPEIDAALAKREADLRQRFERATTRDERDALKTILQRDFNWRDPSARSAAEEFAEILAEFAAIDPQGYARLYDILNRRDSSAAERRRKHASGPTS